MATFLRLLALLGLAVESVLLKVLAFCLMQTFEDFKNDKQAVEYQQRIVDILLKVSVPKNSPLCLHLILYNAVQ